MLICPLIFLLLFSNILSDSSVILRHSLDDKLSVVEEVLMMMLKECNLGLKNIIFYTGTSSDVTSAVLKIPPPEGVGSSILLSDLKIRHLGNLTAINGFIVIFDSYKEWDDVYRYIVPHWRCSENCTVIFVSKNIPMTCSPFRKTLLTMGFFHYYNVYFICVDKKFGPIVITQNIYENTQPPRWNQLSAKAPSLYPWTFYGRNYNADLCRDFHFNRSTPKKNIQIMVGLPLHIKPESKLPSNFIYRGDIADLGKEIVSAQFEFFKRLLNIKFVYYAKTYRTIDSRTLYSIRTFFWTETCTDMIANSDIMTEVAYEVFLFPTLYDRYSILSHMPRPATPLEKIAQFYGIWTLLSLIIISIITFVVLYLKTNRNSAASAFDVLRLLINSGVETPINTLALKIFFCMVFLYFIVIHATFSGNLPKFLTIPEFHGCIDTLEDLAKPQITTIYKVSFEYIDVKEAAVLINKTKNIYSDDDITEKFMGDQNSACIVYNDNAKMYATWNKSVTMNLHMSKKSFGFIMFARVVRPRFFLREKLNWAMTYIFDVGVDINLAGRMNNASRYIEQRTILSQIDYRPINIDDLKFAFSFLCVGNILGLICFFIEIVIHKKYYRKLSLRYFRGFMSFKSKKPRTNIRRIVVKPKQSEPELCITKKLKPGRNKIVSLKA